MLCLQGLLMLLLLVVPTGLWAFYVAPHRSDASDRSAQHPWATIQHAAATVKAGDTVLVAPGEYPSVTVRLGGAPQARLRFVSEVKWGAKSRAREGACRGQSGNSKGEPIQGALEEAADGLVEAGAEGNGAVSQRGVGKGGVGDRGDPGDP